MLLNVEHLLVPTHVQALFQAVAALPKGLAGEIAEDEGDVTVDGVQEPLPKAETEEATGDQGMGPTAESLKE
jgi:hypothetical protein